MAKGKRGKPKGKNDDKGTKEKPKHTTQSSNFISFLKKRAPIYLGILALFAVFIVPELTKGDLEGTLPEMATAEQQRVVDTLMQYNGEDNSGLTVLDVLDDKIAKEYPNEKIYDNKKTSVNLTVVPLDDEPQPSYVLTMIFESHRGVLNYTWNINTETLMISTDDPNSKHIIEIVDFSD